MLNIYNNFVQVGHYAPPNPWDNIICDEMTPKWWSHKNRCNVYYRPTISLPPPPPQVTVSCERSVVESSLVCTEPAWSVQTINGLQLVLQFWKFIQNINICSLIITRVCLVLGCRPVSLDINPDPTLSFTDPTYVIQIGSWI